MIANITIICEIDKCLWLNVFGGEFYLWQNVDVRYATNQLQPSHALHEQPHVEQGHYCGEQI